MNETTESTTEPTPERDWRKVGLWVVVIAVVLLIMWLAFAVRGANMAAAEREREATRIGTVRSAIALASAVEPMLDMRTRGELDDAALQRICDNIVDSGRFELAVVTDQTGRVIATSDRRFFGQPFPEVTVGELSDRLVDGLWEVAAPVQRGGVLFGGVVLRAE